MARIYNFSAGPSMLPESVLRRAQAELPEFADSGQSVLEMSHRSPVYERIQAGAEELLREVLGIGERHAVLFLQGGACTQFAMVPLNLFGRAGANPSADYIETGMWSQRAIAEARRYGEVRITASSEDENFSYIPSFPGVTPGAAYVHITTNNTIFGTRWTKLPDCGSTPLVADMSSNIASEPYDFERFGLVYAGAQKNLGPAGVTVVVIRRDLLGGAIAAAPTMLRYDVHAENASLYNTPPCFSIYVMKLVLEELKASGGVAAAHERNLAKAAVLYDFLDSSTFYRGTARREHRSLMNIPFVLADAAHEKAFAAEAEKAGLVNLKGHRAVGGMRASIYNAMPIEGVRRLVRFMQDFEKSHR